MDLNIAAPDEQVRAFALKEAIKVLSNLELASTNLVLEVASEYESFIKRGYSGSRES